MRKLGVMFLVVLATPWTLDLIILKENGAEVSVKRANVMRASVSSGAARGKHALIGFFVGAALPSHKTLYRSTDTGPIPPSTH